jgi:hypothetical protein
MKTQEMFSALRAFADVAEAGRAGELRTFATVFAGGKREAVAARIKRAGGRWPAQQPHPAALKRSLIAIASGLSACGAKKQAADFEAILGLFQGGGTATVESFVEQIAVALTPPAKPSRAKPVQMPDQALAVELAEQLANAALDPNAFEGVVKRLRDSKRVSTPTLGLVANRFLGNSKAYSGRKAAIDDIVTRQKLDARSHARGKALDRIGV